MRKARTIYALLFVVAAGGLGGCGQGAMEADLTQACIKQGNPMVNEAMCQCMAKETVANLPPKFRQAMLLDMQGKKQEAEALLGDLSFDERAKFGMKQFEVVGKCMGTG